MGDDARKTLAAAFDRPIDPLREVASVLEEVDVDPFEVFTEDVLDPKDLAPATYRLYEMTFAEWRSFMAESGRHPACPNPDHVEAYIEWQTDERGKANANRTVKEKLRRLGRAYRFFRDDPAFPHPSGYSPFALARERRPLPIRKEKEHRRISIEELREMVASVTDLRARAIIGLQCKLGLRAGELANVRLGDLSVPGVGANEHYDELGSHDRLAGCENAIYVPSREERAGNKSRRPRVLPLDREVVGLLGRYLLVRPDAGEPWLVLSQKSHTQMTSAGVNDIWKEAFHPAYAETDDHRAVTSHFGRHRFTTYWRVERDINRQLVKYMRGDRTGAFENARGMDAYLHAYYEDIEPVYREDVFRLAL